ncbi:hypothetical protein JCM19233_4174 [Vibrio astriarenae]|nr:hypothetical protein JCM19233_4174 [Vibrio sp. C7]
MEAVLAKHKEEGVNVVIPVGDLTDNGSTHEWKQWLVWLRNTVTLALSFSR